MDLKYIFGSYKSSNSYTKKADKTITKLGLLLPFGMTLYGLLIQFGLIKSTNNSVNMLGFLIIMFLLILIGSLQTIRPGNTPLSSGLRLFEFYTMSGVYFLLISGMLNPFVFCWPILLLASYNYFELRGLQLGVVALFLTVLIDIILIHNFDVNTAVTDMMLFVTLSFTGIAIVTVMRTHEIRKEKFFNNIINESLQRDQVATIVNNLTDAILSVNTNGIVQVYNAASLSLLDTNINLNGKNIDNLLNLSTKDGNEISIIEELRRSKSVVQRDDLYYTFSDGEKIRLDFICAPIRTSYNFRIKKNSLDGYVLILRDITKTKNVEEERDEFISVISHELRTPITITEGTVSNIQEMMDHPNATKSMLKDSIQVAHEQIMYLSNIVNDLGTLSKAERGVDKDPEVVDIADLANDIIKKFQDYADKKKILISLIIDKDVDSIFTSYQYLHDLLQNIVNNAIKYTKKGEVSLTISKHDNDITFAIKDTGIGISKTDRLKIFDRFYRSEDYRTRETGGTGLGLYVASRLAEQIGTKINLDSQINKGSTFSFTLPIKPKKVNSETESGKNKYV